MEMILFNRDGVEFEGNVVDDFGGYPSILACNTPGLFGSGVYFLNFCLLNPVGDLMAG